MTRFLIMSHVDRPIASMPMPTWLSRWLGSPSEDVSFEHTWPIPLWLTIVLLIGIIALVAALYWPQRRTLQSNPSTRGRAFGIVTVLGLLRTFSIIVVLWMLAAWILRPFETDRPILAILVDRSASMSVEEKQQKNSPPASRLEQVIAAMRSLPARVQQNIQSKYRVQIFSVGESLEEVGKYERADLPNSLEMLSPDAAVSRIGDGIRDMLALGRGQSLAGIVVFTDGVTTRGLSLSDAAGLARRQLVPTYFVGVGRPQQKPDLWLSDLIAPQLAFQGDTINIQARLFRHDVDQATHRVRLIDVESGANLDEVQVTFSDEQRERAFQLKMVTASLGTRAVRVEVASVDGESDISNNQLTHMIDVRDTAIAVLLVQRFPSFEFRFLKHLLERTRQSASSDRPAFRLTSVLEEGDPQYAAQDSSAQLTMPVTEDDFSRFDVIILGDASPNILSPKSQESLRKFVSEQGGGVLIFAGPNHMPFDFNDGPLSSLLPIEPVTRSTSSEDPFGWHLTDIGQQSLPLQLESTGPANRDRWNALPKQTWRVRGLRAKPVAQVLATSDNAAKDPILLSQFVGSGRIVFQATDETFQWQSYLGDDLYYQRYWIQMLRWLAVAKSSPTLTNLRLTSDKSRYESGEIVRLDARVGNELLTDLSDLTIAVDLLRDGQAEKSFPMQHSQDDPGSFSARVEQLAAGKYRAEVNLITEQKAFVDFSVVEKPGELSQLGPATQEMIDAASISHGKYVAMADLDQLWPILPHTKPIRLQPLPSIPIWNHWLATSLLIVLLTAEWIIRRSMGLF